jgi:hypothetical protein
MVVSYFAFFSFILFKMKIVPGESVIVVLHTPREKLFGILDEINAAGLHVRAIDLSYFDDWCRSITEREPYLPMTDYFLPMWRLERMMRDEASEEAASMTEQFEQRTGRTLGEF